jgi:hypothetical protein
MGSWGGLIFSLIAIIAAIWGLAVLGSEDAALDELIARLGIGVFSVAAIVGLYLYGFKNIPQEWDAGLRKQIDSLEAQLVPQLEFTFRSDDNKYLERRSIYVGMKAGQELRREALIGRVAVKNPSHSRSVRDVEVSLIHYVKDGHTRPVTIDKKLIAHSITRPIVTLHARREETYELFRCYKDKVELLLEAFADRETVQVERGRYRIKVTASGESSPRVDAFFFLEFSAYDRVEFRPWMAGDTSHDDASATTLDGSSDIPLP